MVRARSFSFVLLTYFLSLTHTLPAQEDLSVIQGKSQWLQYTDAGNALYHHFAGEAYQHLAKRTTMIRGLRSLDDWQKRQEMIKETLYEIVGPFPEKTPLNSRIVRTIKKETYRVEHIVYESQPQFYVTASLFIPNTIKGRDKAPVVIYCSGHANEGYRSDVYQHVILNLVRKNFIVFAFDPVGQGERLEYFDPAKGGSALGGPTSEHSYPGTQAFIAGGSQARYMIWDGIRAVDYLLTRKEVDPLRIGITGRSGGGTQSSYIAAFDERIKAAAPECYITNFTRLLQSIGPQDAEQNLPRGIMKGIDHGDLLLVRAPKPALMITTTRDMFSIQGARETATEVAGIYKAYGNEMNFGMVEDDAPHASTKKNREAMYAFFQRHLNNAGEPDDEDVTILTDEEIKVTSTGQVSTSLGGATVFMLNQRQVQKQTEKILQSRQSVDNHFRFVAQAAKTLSGYREPMQVIPTVFTGRIQRDGYAVEKYFLKGEGNYVIPYLLMVPELANGKIILYLHPSGKVAEASAGEEIEWFVKKGFTVMAPDLPGTGELGSGDFEGDAFIGGISHNIWYSSILIGRSIVGLQAGDVARLIKVVTKDTSTSELYAIARKEMSPLLLHVASFVPAIQRIALIESLCSYRSLVMSQSYHSPFVTGAVAGSLTAYDLPDLAASLAPRKMMLVNATDATGQSASDEIEDELSFIRQAYEYRQADKQLTITSGVREEEMRNLLNEWLK